MMPDYVADNAQLERLVYTSQEVKKFRNALLQKFKPDVKWSVRLYPTVKHPDCVVVYIRAKLIPRK